MADMAELKRVADAAQKALDDARRAAGEKGKADVDAKYAAELAKLKAWKNEQYAALDIKGGKGGTTHRCPVRVNDVDAKAGKITFTVFDRETGGVLETKTIANADINKTMREIRTKYMAKFPKGDWDGHSVAGWIGKLRNAAGLQKTGSRGGKVAK